jgi:hypothetical protein
VQTGIQVLKVNLMPWMPAFAGMTWLEESDIHLDDLMLNYFGH